MKLNRKYLATFVALTVVGWGCTPDDYPTTPRFDPPPQEDVLPDGELFFYEPPAGVSVTSVSVPGEFNGWNPTAAEAQMTQLSDGRWVAGIELAEGTYQYKYHFNGTTWAGNMCNEATWGDPDNGGQVDADLDSCEGENAVRTIGTPQPTGHTFLYIVPEGVGVEVVTAAGTFQPEGAQWNNTSDTLSNIWTYTVDMEPGTYQYKYQFNETNGWAGNMCDEATWGHPDYGNAVDPDNDNCDGENAVITITDAGPHTFRYIVPAGVGDITQITVAGEFQDPQWTPGVDFFMETFTRTYALDAGTYEYKFIFDGNWAGNMCAEGTYADGGMADANGSGTCNGENAVLTID
ncbi:MAG TPA: hypothetical protein VMN78_11590 [Longimicrobiales bacterium]|nr:hypothetical protein [Longimicrobiales bacterium]